MLFQKSGLIGILTEAKDNGETRFLKAAADLMFRYLVLFAVTGYALQEVVAVLQKRRG